MKYAAFREKTLRHLSDFKINSLGVVENGEWKINQKPYPHILPKNQLAKNFLNNNFLVTNFNLKQTIKLHSDAHHLNSSQVMCINFFQPLISEEIGRRILKEILLVEKLIMVSKESSIVKAGFEFVPYKAEQTNFDFFCEFDTGEKIYFETKYTESSFGGLSPNQTTQAKYLNKWDSIYQHHILGSPIEGISMTDFCKNYQIWRNVAYVKSSKDYVVFVVPQENEDLSTEIDETVEAYRKSNPVEFSNINRIDWTKLLDSALNITQGTVYHKHFADFRYKYLV